MWKDLSLREKSAMMKVAIKNGITSLEEIENKYNKYANGGLIEEDKSSQKNVGEETLNKYKGTKLYDALSKDWEFRFYPTYNIREKPEGTEAVNYFKSYIGSAGFNRVLDNQEEWWNKRHPYRKYWTNLFGGASSVVREKFLENKDKNTVVPFFIDTPLIGSHTTHDNARRNFPIIIAEESVNPNFVLGHEIGHAYDKGTDYYRSPQKEALDLNKKTEHNNHDELIDEKHADLWGLRYMLYKEGIYDSRSNKDVTEEQISRLRKKYPNERPFQQMDDTLITKLLNIVAENSTNKEEDVLDNNYAANGGLLNEYAEGGPKNNKLGILDTSTNKRFIYDNNSVPLDELVITGNSPERLKRQQDWERNREIISYLPILGTSLDIAEAIQNPNAGTIIPAAFGLTTDLIGGKIIYSLGKGASKTATKATSRTFRRNLNPNFVKTMGASILNLEDLYMNALQNGNNP